MIPGFDPTKTFKLTIDHNKVDEVLEDFPLLINLTDSSGTTNTSCSGIFEELYEKVEYGSDADLLIHGGGPDGGTNIVDSSPSELTITNNSVVFSDDATHYSTTSLYFNGGATCDLEFAAGSFWSWGLDDFTVDFWAYHNSKLCVMFDIDGGGTTDLNLAMNNTTIYLAVVGRSATSSSSVVTLSVWNHWAVVRKDGEFKVFVNGEEQIHHTDSIAVAHSIASTVGTKIGGEVANYFGLEFNGYMEEFRVVKGTAEWWSTSFTPPSHWFYIEYDYNKKIAIEYKGFEDHEVDDPDVVFLLNSNVSSSIQDFVDSSSYNHTITNLGSVKHVTTEKKFGATSIDCPTSNDYLSIPDHTSLNFTNTDTFTIDFWLFPTDLVNDRYIVSKYEYPPHKGYSIGLSSGGIMLICRNTVTTNDLLVKTTTDLTEDTWTHIAVVYTGTSKASGVFIYFNGVLQPQEYVRDGLTASIATTSPFYINWREDQAGALEGYLDDLRVSNTTRWLSEFTPPTSAHIKDSYDSLLIHSDTTHGSTTFTDSSNIGHTITVNGNTSHSTVKSKIGSSAIYFDGSLDGLSIVSHPSIAMGTGDFTIDCWINTTEVSTQNSANRRVYCSAAANATNKLHLLIENVDYLNAPAGAVSFYTTDRVVLGKTNVCDGSWHHIAVVRESGISYLYLDGVCQGSAIDTTNYISDRAYIGSYNSTKGCMEGYIDEFRISKGIARWSTDFTPPTSKHVDDDNTVLLVQSDAEENYTFTDISSSNITITPGTTSIHTTDQSVFSTSGIYFDGTADSTINVGHHNNLIFGDGDFTVDYWEYRISNPGTGASAIHFPGPGGVNYGLLLGYAYTDKHTVYASSNGTSWDLANNLHISADLTIGTWRHQAIVKHNGYCHMYSDGVKQDSFASDGVIAQGTEGFTIGRYVTSLPFHGYMQQIRITKRALWLSDFTPSTSPAVITTTVNSVAQQQCPVEIERWDYVNKSAQLWTKVPKISSGTDTTLLLYYDSTASDNTTYVGETNSTPAQNVWNNDYWAVYNFSKTPTGVDCVLDSTASHQHGSTYNMGSTDLVDAPVGKAYQTNGTTSYIEYPFSSMPYNDLTIQVLYKAIDANSVILDNQDAGVTYPTVMINADDEFTFNVIYNSWTPSATLSITEGFTLNTFDYAGIVWEGNGISVSHNEGNVFEAVYDPASILIRTHKYETGRAPELTYTELIIRNLHITEGRRSQGWLNTGYYSAVDNLISFAHSSYTYEGYVEMEGVKVSKKVLMYERSTGILVDSSISDPVTGKFELNIPYSDLYFLIILPDVGDNYNLLAYDKLDPTV